MIRPVFIIALLLASLSQFSIAQISIPNTLAALAVHEAPRLDGRLEEKCWKDAVKISNFIQRELLQGEPASEQRLR